MPRSCCSLTTGHLLALLAGDDLTPFRTAAPVALACQYLARPGASTLAMLGSGEQSRLQVRLILHVLPCLQRVRIFSRTPEHRRDFAHKMSELVPQSVEAIENPERAVQDADIIC